MKNIYTFLIFAIFISGCAGNRYLLSDKGKDKRFLITAIHNAAKTGEISQKPMIVIDGIPHDIKNKRLELEKEDIKQIDIVKRDKAIMIYGEEAKNGLLLITTKTNSVKDSKPVEKDDVLFLLGNKKISKSEMEKLNPNDIESIDVIKDKENVKRYTSEDYSGVVIIYMKKKN